MQSVARTRPSYTRRTSCMRRCAVLFIVSSCERGVRHHTLCVHTNANICTDEVFRVQRESACRQREKILLFCPLCLAHSRERILVFASQRASAGCALPLPERFIVHTETQLDYFPSPPTYKRNRPGAHISPLLPTHEKRERKQISERVKRAPSRGRRVCGAALARRSRYTHTHTHI